MCARDKSYFHVVPSLQLTSRRVLHVTGQASTEYVSDETSMTPILNLHLLLEQMRVRAHRFPIDTLSDDEKRPKPPCVLVIGPESSGKTTTSKILANYAVRSPVEWQPMLINLDTGDVCFQTCSHNDTIHVINDLSVGWFHTSGNSLSYFPQFYYPCIFTFNSPWWNSNYCPNSTQLFRSYSTHILVWLF